MSVGGLRKYIFGRRTSTGSEPFPLLICLEPPNLYCIFFLTVIETICPKMCSKSRLKSAKSPLSVDVRRSKTSLLKLPILKVNTLLLDSKTNLNYISSQSLLHLFSCDRCTWVECYVDSVFIAPTPSLI